MKLLLSIIVPILTISSLSRCARAGKQNNYFSSESGNIVTSIGIEKIDDDDKIIMTKTLNQVCEAVPSGQITAWKNSSNNHKGTFIPDKIYKNAQGQDCRRYNYSVEINGEVKRGYSKACRNYNGVWLEVS